ncbi:MULTISPECIES: glycosyltransferase [Hymenobacter]|uniref:Glycosyltransferase involved in cell wall bisynthesis n=1 Tax=Hymenobacter mucosus TaxID=1411120 RepID=A0A238XP15_9BACT|nr:MULTISPECIES: glycosyltransferase [Hymenobacter]SNR60328.1 Glycosyltransferase involved in cell wall bisynthesis [Hymenobacter mucosus]
MPPRLVFTVTTDLNYDQRMQRICGSLAAAGYAVLLIGREWPTSRPLTAQPYQQHRLRCWNTRGKLFYLEYNLRLLLFLLRKRASAWCAIDLDTALPVWLRARLGGQPFVYDAHELFTEVPEVVARPAVQRLWRRVEAFVVPRAHLAYTVGPALAHVFAQRYGCPFHVIRNISRLEPHAEEPTEGYILYQGALNAGRGMEVLLDAMPHVHGRLVVCGEGDLSGALRAQAERLGLLASGQVEFRGFVLPLELRAITRRAAVGVMLLENQGLSYYYSLANKFFDYLHAGIPQVVVDFPEYRALNDQYEVAELVAAPLSSAAVAAALNRLLPGGNVARYQQLRRNCRHARQALNWQSEEARLLALYATLPGCALPVSVPVAASL